MARKPLTTRQVLSAVKSLRQEVMPPAGFNASVRARLQPALAGPGWASRLSAWLSPKPALAALSASALALALVLLVSPGPVKVSQAPQASPKAPAALAAAAPLKSAKPALTVAKQLAPSRAALALAPAAPQAQAVAAPAKPLPNLNRQPGADVAMAPQAPAPALAARLAAPTQAAYAGAAGGGLRIASASSAPAPGLRSSLASFNEAGPTITATATPNPASPNSSGLGYTSKAYPTILRSSRGANMKIRASSGARGSIRVTVYDRLGNQVAVIGNGSPDTATANVMDYSWNGTDESGAALASGIYIVRVQGPGYDDRHKVVVLR